MSKLTNELKKGLALLADVLPETTETFREKVTGKQLLGEGVTHVSAREKVQPGGIYGRPAQRPVNHGRRLHGAYTNWGRAGVLDYCRPHIEPEHFEEFAARLSELVPVLG